MASLGVSDEWITKLAAVSSCDTFILESTCPAIHIEWTKLFPNGGRYIEGFHVID